MKDFVIFLLQQTEILGGGDSSLADKSSSIGSLRQTIQFQATGSASTSSSKGKFFKSGCDLNYPIKNFIILATFRGSVY